MRNSTTSDAVVARGIVEQAWQEVQGCSTLYIESSVQHVLMI